MNRAQKILCLIVALFGVLLLYQAVFGTFEYVPGSDRVEYQYGGSDVSSFSMYIAFALLAIQGFDSFLKYGTIRGGAIISLVVLSVIMLFFLMADVIEYGLLKVLRQSTGPIVFFILWGLFFSQKQGIWELTLKIAKVLGPLLAIASAFVSVFFVNSYGGHIGNSPQIMLLGNGFWPLAIAMLGDEKQDRVIIKGLFILSVGCILLTSVLYGTRSWIIQCILLLGLYFYKESKGKIISLTTIGFAALIAYFVINLVSGTFTDNWDYLSNRMGDNTRSFQYNEIFSQFSFSDLFFGRGTFGTYRSSLYGNYLYIDNTLVYTWFHWGFIPMLCLFSILIYPFLKILFSRGASRNDIVRASILLLWFLSLNGLSVYNTMTLDLRNAFIVLLLGKEYMDCKKLNVSNFKKRLNGLENKN